jgi:glycosylphosphatidylinositol deacylase
MTYMWPAYLPVALPAHDAHPRYRLWLYQEGMRVADSEMAERIVIAQSGSPVLFIPGNGGSYRQVWPLASSSIGSTRGSKRVSVGGARSAEPGMTDT